MQLVNRGSYSADKVCDRSVHQIEEPLIESVYEVISVVSGTLSELPTETQHLQIPGQAVFCD